MFFFEIVLFINKDGGCFFFEFCFFISILFFLEFMSYLRRRFFKGSNVIFVICVNSFVF